MISNLELFEYFKYFDWLVHKFNSFLNSKDQCYLDSSRGQGRVLFLLLDEDGLSTKDLSKRTGFTISSLNEILSKLEKKGLVERKPLESDKRVIVNSLTPKALELRPKLNLGFFDCLDEFQREELVKILSTLSSDLENKIINIDDPKLVQAYQKRKAAVEVFLSRDDENFRWLL